MVVLKELKPVMIGERKIKKPNENTALNPHHPHFGVSKLGIKTIHAFNNDTIHL